jgi:apolipoprotein N-acyltransferase
VALNAAVLEGSVVTGTQAGLLCAWWVEAVVAMMMMMVMVMVMMMRRRRMR